MILVSFKFVDRPQCSEKSNDDCPGDKMRDFSRNSTQNILIVWDATDMDTLFENINVDNDDDSIGTHPDVILTATKGRITSQNSMNCTSIDGPADGSF
jgi:hypothetical protein